jgi:hypothetical protein
MRIDFGDTDLREKAKAAQGKWDPKKRAWYIQFGKIKGTEEPVAQTADLSAQHSPSSVFAG